MDAAARLALILLAAAAPPTPLSTVTVIAKRPTHVADVEVEARRCPTRPSGPPGAPPRVVAASPAEGAIVAPGPVTIRLTFDQPMNCGWAVEYDSKDELCAPVGEWDLPKRTTWRVRCTLSESASWSFHFGAVEGHGFESLAGAAAQPLGLTFTTGGGGRAAPEPPPGARLICPEHRLRGAGPRCRYLREGEADLAPSAPAPAPAPRPPSP